MIVEGLGWRPDLPDYRDARFRYSKALADEVVAELPPRASPQRRELDRHPVRDQGRAGSCVGHGVGLIAAVERNVTQRSPLFIYAEARKMIGELHLDQGAYIRDGVKVVANLGAPVESKWPYDLANLYTDPHEKADIDAAKRKVFSYHRLETGRDFRSCLASGHLFTIGFSVYPNFFNPPMGVVGMPQGSQGGGHCVAIIGYDDDFANSQWGKEAAAAGIAVPAKVYEGQNSWSDRWGRKGRFVIDANYLETPYLAGDPWTLRGFSEESR